MFHLNLLAYGRRFGIYEDTFMRRKKRSEVTYKYHDEERTAAISDSEDSDDEVSDECVQRLRNRTDEYALLNKYSTTRLDGAFDLLLEWCKQNIDRIEQQRNRERESNGPEVRRLAQDKEELSEEIAELEMKLQIKKNEMSRIKRHIVALTDVEPLVSSESLSLEKKLFLFCKAMGEEKSHFRFRDSGKAWLLDTPLVKSHRELVKNYHQMMAAMRVLHEDMVDAPSRTYKKFKVRKPSPTKWMILSDDHREGDERDLFAEIYCSNMKDARMACTALQNLLYSWQCSNL